MDITTFAFSYDVIIAHGPGCYDGATAAWSFWRLLPLYYREQLSNEGGFYSNLNIDSDLIDNNKEIVDNEPYIHPNSFTGAIKLQKKGFPVVFAFSQPNEPVPDELITDKKVLILDLDMGDSLVNIVEAARSVFLCDHHDSTPKTILRHSQCLLDKNRHKFATYINTNSKECGSTLAWRMSHSASIPDFVEIIRIRDTWSWDDLPHLEAKAVLTSLHVKRSLKSFYKIEDTFQTWNQYFPLYVQQGKAVMDYEKSIIKQISKQCDLGYIQTNDDNVYNVAYTSANILHSEVGSSMRYYAEKRFKVPIHFCCTWKYVSFKKLVSVSLRDGIDGLNLSQIARTVKNSDGKGGGHAASAAFIFNGIENFHNFILESPPVHPPSFPDILTGSVSSSRELLLPPF